MKNFGQESFYLDIYHPRTLYRNYNNGIENYIRMEFICPVIKFHQLKNSDSKITLNNESSLKNLKVIKEVYGIDSILTLLKEKNYDNNIKCTTEEYQLYLFEFDYNLSKLNNSLSYSNKKNFIDNILKIYNILMIKRTTLLIHKAGGELKTNIFLYSLLRLNGETKEESLEIIRTLRNGNKKSIGDFNIEFLEKNLIEILKEKLKLISKY